jgi:hypothetical protein
VVSSLNETSHPALVVREERTPELSPEERALLVGDLSRLTEGQRADLVLRICKSVGLNPLTKPLQYLQLSGRLVLYTTKDATDQLRRLHNVSTSIVSRERLEDVYVVTARCTLPNGRVEERIGAVTIGGLKGDALCNALMKSETKAVRRCTLAACGLGFLDESETDTIPGATVVSEVRPALPASPSSADIPLAPAAWYTRLRDLAMEARGFGCEPPAVPTTGLRMAEARALAEQLKEQISRAQDAAFPAVWATAEEDR